eukprot:GFUD01040723.1.p1 GENE.GFUD01040723.1~~GFUD01040723.1.p1  ORF type:complete len:614 (+),score=142.33 GFUD01040723.1:68-1909(+)
MSNNTSPTTPSRQLALHNFLAVPSYVVALCVVAGAVVTVAMLMVVHNCLLAKRRHKRPKEQSPIRETERLREEVVGHGGPLCDDAGLTSNVKPRPMSSIFSRGDFVMEVLEGVNNASDFSNDRVEDENSICEADRVTIALDELLEKQVDDEFDTVVSSSVLHTPPRESTNMQIFLEDLDSSKFNSSTDSPTVPERGEQSDSSSGWNCTAMGLRVRQDTYREEGSTAALRGSDSSEQGESGTEAEVEIYEETQNNSDKAYKEVQGNEHDGEDISLNGSYADILADGEEITNQDSVTSQVPPEDNQGEENITKNSSDSPKTCKQGSPVRTPKSGGSQENLGPNSSPRKYPGQEESLVRAKTSFSSTSVSSHSPGHSLVTKLVRCSSSENITAEQTSHIPQPVSPYSSGGKLDPVPCQTSPSVPVISIPFSDQKRQFPSSPLNLSTPTASLPSLLTSKISIMSALPLVERAVSVSHLSLHASGTHLPATPLSYPTATLPSPLTPQTFKMSSLPLLERAVSVSHLSLHSSGTHLPATPLSDHSEYSPVYSMQFGSARWLVSEDTSYCASTRISGGSVMGSGSEHGDVLTDGESCDGVKNPLEVKVIIQEDSTDLSPK